MLLLFPILSFGLIFLLLLGKDENPHNSSFAYGHAFITAAVLWGTTVIVSTEILGYFGAITRGSISLVWLLMLLTLTGIAIQSGRLLRALSQLRTIRVKLSRLEIIGWGSIGFIFALLFLVAWISPPNNVDSFLYHMSRVVHWAQNQSLRHYATTREHQLLKPIWAETAILHLRILWGSDRPVNLVQWFSMVGSVIGVTSIVNLLGVRRKGTLLTAIFATTIPMGILQASSTQNDYVTAFWAVCLAYYVVLSVVKTLHSQDFIALGLTLGLGFLTKGTFYVYAPPLMIWFFFSRLKQVGVRKLVMETMLLTIIAVTLNAPFWVRNIQTYGGPYGTSDWLRENLTIDEISFLMHGSTAYAASPSDELPSQKSPPSYNVGATMLPYESNVRLVEQGHARRTESFVGDRVNSLLKRVLRTAGFNFVTPSYAINSTILKVFERFPAVFDEEYISSWNQVAWSHEDTAPNTLHFVLILLSFPVMMWIWYKDGQRLPGIYTLVIATTFLLIPLIIGHGASIWGMRYQLPFFVLWAPVFGVVASRLRPPGISVFLGGLLLVGAIPWLLFNNTRPLIGRVPWPTRVGSIINTPTAEIMFAINPALMPSYIEATDVIQASSCKRIGLRIDSDDLEYLFWWLLEAPQSGIQIESVFTYAHLESLIDWDFEPCAILCTICGNRTRLHGLPLTGDFSRVNLFAGDGFTLDIDG